MLKYRRTKVQFIRLPAPGTAGLPTGANQSKPLSHDRFNVRSPRVNRFAPANSLQISPLDCK